MSNYFLKELIKSPNKFVVGDCPGIDSFVIDYLKENNVKDVIVYHIGEVPMYNQGFETLGNFGSDFYRDYTMTLNSDEDICWVRKIRSGTYMNIERRNWMNTRKNDNLTYSYDDRIKFEANIYF